MSYDPSKVAFVDIETTGLDPDHDQIWEIAVIADDREHHWQQEIIVPDHLKHLAWSDLVSPWVLTNTGILDRYGRDDVEMMNRDMSMVALQKWTRGRHMVGACPWFDSQRLFRDFRAMMGVIDGVPVDSPWHYHLIDVENLAVGYLTGARQAMLDEGYPIGRVGESLGPPWKSTYLSLALGVDPDDFEPKHSALADARWAKAMYEAIMGPPA